MSLEESVVRSVLQSLPHLLELPSKHVSFDLDDEADVLYVSFEHPQGATESELTSDNVIIRYRDAHLVGITVLNARRRLQTFSTDAQAH